MIFWILVLIFIIISCNNVSATESSSLSQVYLCLSGYGNDSAREIIFKVWLLIKQGVQEICYSNNDIIVFHVCQSKKHHKKFLEKSYEMNSKHKNLMASGILNIFEVIFFKNNLIWPFDYWSTWPKMCCFFETSFPMSFLIDYFNFIPQR